MDAQEDASSAREWIPGLVELVGSMAAVFAIVGIFVNYVGAHLSFFGQTAIIDDEQVHSYWALLATLAAGVVGSAAGAGWRRSRWAWWWHGLVLVLGIGVAVMFSVTTAGPVVPEPTAPSPDPSGPGAPACHSGGDSTGCPGG